MRRLQKRSRRSASNVTSNQGSVTSTSKQSSFLLKKSCLAILSILSASLPSVRSLSTNENVQTIMHQTTYTPDLHLHRLRNTMLTQPDRITMSILGDPPAEKVDDGPTTLEAFFGYFLIVIAGLSLGGWGYVYYLRYKYSQRAKEEEGQVKAAKKCCQGSGSGVSPIALNTPPRSKHGDREEEVEIYDIESAHVQPQEQHNHNQHPQHLPPRVRNRQQIHQHHETSMMSNSTYEPSIEESDEEDSFARELQIAARTDQQSWAHQIGNQKALALKQKRVPSLKPPKKDVEHIPVDTSFGIFDSFFGWKKSDRDNEVQNTAIIDHEQGFTQSPKISYLPEQLQPPAETHSFSRSSFNPRGGRSQNQQFQPHVPMNSSDPSDVMFSDSSGASSSYAGKNSSVEESEHEEDGFELVGYLKKRNDGMNEYLLNPIQAGDDASFGDASGMEMSLGATTAVTNQTASTTGKGSEGRGFYVIDEQNDLMHEYIPKEEYDAAVMAAAHVLKNSPRNSPRNSPLRGRSEAEIQNTWLNENGELDRVPSAPSDEHDSRFPPLMTSTQESSEGHSVSVDESISMDPTTAHMSLDSSTGESEPALSKDIYNELRNVSAFIRNYEKKQTKGNSSHLWSSDSNEMVDSSFDTSTFHSNGSQPSVTLTSTSEAESTSKEKKKNKFRKPTFGRKKKGHAVQDEVSEVEVKVKSKQKNKKNSKLRILPPRHRTHEEMEDSDHQDYDDDVIIMPNPNRPNEPRRRQLPVAGNGTYPGIGMSPSGESAASDTKFLRNEIESFFTQKDTSMSVMSESIEVLHRPIVEKANPKNSHKPPQTEAESTDDVHETTFETEFSGGASPTAVEYNRLGAMPFNPKESHLAPSPFDRNTPSPPSMVRVKSPGRLKKLKSPSPLVSSRKDTIPVYDQSVYSQPSQFKPLKQGDQVPLAQSARSILQTGARNIASIIDKTRQSQSPKESSGSLQSKEGESQANEGVQSERIRNNVSGLETKLQTGARSFMSIFEGKGSDEAVVSDPAASPIHLDTRNSRSSYDRNMTDRISNRLEQIRRNVKERAASNGSPRFSPRNQQERSAQNKKSQETKTRQIMDIFDEDEERPRASRKVQVATFVSPESMISPSAAHHARRERTPGRLLKSHHLDVSQQSGDDTTESPSRASIESRPLAGARRDVPLAVEAVSKRNVSSANSTAGSVSSARNLISMFESRQSNVSGIFPSGENWQHAGNLKSQRKFAPSPR